MKYATSSGYIAIMTVLILLVFSLALLLAVPYLSIDGAKLALALSQGETVLAGLEGCAEDALLLALRDESYAGGTYTYLGMVCEVTIEKSDPLWTLSLTGSQFGITRTLEAAANRTVGNPGVLTLVHWLEQ